MSFGTGDGARYVLTLWISAVGVIAATLLGILAGLFSLWLLVGAAVVGIGTLFAVLWYPLRYTAALRGSCDEQALRVSKGVLWRQEIYVPLTSLRTVEIWGTPLQCVFHCRTIILRFAGGAIILPLLQREQAVALTRWVEEMAVEREERGL